MPSGDSNVVQVIEPDTELRTYKGIGRRFELSSDTIWLEAVNAGCNELHIVSPPGNYRVSFNRGARNSGGCEALLITLPGLCECYFFSFAYSISNKGILSIAI